MRVQRVLVRRPGVHIAQDLQYPLPADPIRQEIDRVVGSDVHQRELARVARPVFVQAAERRHSAVAQSRRNRHAVSVQAQPGREIGKRHPVRHALHDPGRFAPAHEIELHLTAKATVDGELLFLVELVYGGIFVISGVPAEQLEPVVMIECPRLLFPFARRIIADCSRDGGYPPLMLEPIDFAQMYLQRRSQTPSEQQSPDDKS